MKIVIDADACPVVDQTIETAKKYGLEVILVCDTAHYISRDDCRVIIVSKGADSADFIIVREALPGDIVVTQDYGLAAMCLGMGINAINQNGIIYNDKNIDEMLMRRHIGRVVRSRRGRSGRISPRKKENDLKFINSLTKLIERLIKK